MYEKYNITAEIVKDAEKYIIQLDRSRYDEYFKLIEQYCIDNKIIIGGNVGIDLLVKKEKTKDSYMYNLYGDDIYNKARQLLIKLYKDIKHKFIEKDTLVLETNILDKEYTIYIDTRTLCKLHALDLYHNVSLYNIIDPVERMGNFIEKYVKIMSGEVYLIDIYRGLYRPYAESMGGYKTYTYYREIEEKVINSIIGTIENKIFNLYNFEDEKIKGSSAKYILPYIKEIDNVTEIDNKIQINDLIEKEEFLLPFSEKVEEEEFLLPLSKKGGEEKMVNKKEVEERIMKILLTNEENDVNRNNILIGDYAMRVKTGEGKLQIISDVKIEELTEMIRKELENLKRKVIYKKFELKIPGDFQIKKYIIYIEKSGDAKNDASNQIPMIEVFNSSEFEVIPFKYERIEKIGNVKMGNLYVLIRFKFIDIWILKLIYNIKKENKENVNAIEGYIKGNLVKIKKLREEIKKTEVKELFSMEKEMYVGKYLNEVVMKKKYIKEMKKVYIKRLYAVEIVK